MNWKLFTLAFASLFAGLLTVALTARVSPVSSRSEPCISIEHRGPAQRVLLVFIDSLSRDVARTSELMPTLGRLAREGASFDVEPCRDQLTYLCLRAAFTGHDDSSLLAIGDNFRPDHDAPPESLLSAVAATQDRVNVIGSSDFHPYRRALFAEHLLSKSEETPEGVRAMLKSASQDNAQLEIVSLASGDMVAHAHGARSPEYREAFRRLDRVVLAITEAIDPDTHLVVFGDHGHDERGRHLPGTTAHTWAVYHGPAFRSGVTSSISITDHRALLGVLLGVATEPSYRGPPLASIFEPKWVASALQGGLPKLEVAKGHDASAHARYWIWVAGIGLVGVLAAWPLLARHRPRWLLVAIAASAAVIAAAIGVWYDEIRCLVHDHGDSPERALSLIVPLALGCVVASIVVRNQRYGVNATRAAWAPTAATCSLVTIFLLMLPTSYYYGSRRAVVLAAVLAVATKLAHYLRRSSSRLRERLVPSLALAFAAIVLASLYPVRQLGPETGGASTWALDARIYTQTTWLPLIVSKFILYLILVAPRASRHSSDAAGAAGLLSASALVELAGARLPREAYACLFCALLVGSLFLRHRAPSTLLSGGLLLLEHLYGGDGSHIAPIEMILAATAAALLAWRSMQLTVSTRSVLTGLTVTIAVYLMLWPTVGFHVAGIDFGYMFQWVPEAKYEQLWQVIAFGVVVKLALPLILVMGIAREHLSEPLTIIVVTATLAAKVLLLSIMIACFATHHAMGSQQATAMLAELILVMFAMCCCVATMPASKPLATPRPRPALLNAPGKLIPRYH